MQINLAEMPLVGMLGGAHWAGPGACHRGCHISRHVFIPLLFVLDEAVCLWTCRMSGVKRVSKERDFT